MDENYMHPEIKDQAQKVSVLDLESKDMNNCHLHHFLERVIMDKESEQAHPFELNTEKTIHCTDVETWSHSMQQIMPAF